MKFRDDLHLIEHLLDGEERAFSAFFDMYFPRLFQFALSRLRGNEYYAEEVVQATFAVVFRKLQTFRGEASLFTWMCTLCRHEIHAFLKREERHAEWVSISEPDEGLEIALSVLKPEGIDPFELYEQDQIAALIKRVRVHIPSLYSDVLVWKYCFGFSTREIADKIRRNVKATESVIGRARIAFREAYLSLTEESGETDKSQGIDNSRAALVAGGRER